MNKSLIEKKSMKFGCLNVRGWGLGKFEDIFKELSEWSFDFVGITETHLRDRFERESDEYMMIGKGRCRQDKMGGGVALIYKKDRNIRLEEIDIGNGEMSEDIIAMRVECKGGQNETESFVIVIVYMTVEGERAKRENKEKYKIINGIVKEYARERIIVMGDMNGHIGIMLGERINKNGEMLLEFMDELNMENLNVTLAEGRVTWCAREQESAIDYVLVNEKNERIRE